MQPALTSHQVARISRQFVPGSSPPPRPEPARKVVTREAMDQFIVVSAIEFNVPHAIDDTVTSPAPSGSTLRAESASARALAS